MHVQLPLEGLKVSMPYIHNDGVAIICINGTAFDFSNDEIKSGIFDTFHVHVSSQSNGLVTNGKNPGEYSFDIDGGVLELLRKYAVRLKQRV